VRRFVKVCVAVVLLASLTLQADPFLTVAYTKATEYDDGTPIPTEETLTETMYCGTVSGGPYDVEIAVTYGPPAYEDFAPCVKGMFGTFYLVMVHHSELTGLTSEYSNEVSFFIIGNTMFKNGSGCSV